MRASHTSVLRGAIGASIALVLACVLIAAGNVEPPRRLSTSGSAGCDVTFRGTNSGRHTITFEHGQSRVKIRRLTWKRLGSWSENVRPGGTLSSTVRLAFGCDAQRRYKLYFGRSGGGDVSCYYPGPDRFTNSRSLNLGDIERYFDPQRSTASCLG